MTEIKINLSQRCGIIKPMNAVNNGPVGNGVRKSYSSFDAYKAACIPYARNHDAAYCVGYGGEHTVDVHRIFKNFDADENDPASYWFEPTDDYLKSIVDAGTRVFYRLGASIEHRYKYGTKVPKDYLKWAKICEHIIRHYTEGWANGFHYDIEYWEIWNEPDLGIFDGASPCWQGNAQQFCDLYCVASTYLKKQFPHLKIGGCAFYSVRDNELKRMLLDCVVKGEAVMDFYSYHWYGRDPFELSAAIRNIRSNLDSLGLSHVPTILNEWNYIKSFSGEDWKYSIKVEKSLKGAAFIASIMCTGQHGPLDMLMYYDARPSGMNGMFRHETYECLKGYYPFLMYSELSKIGTQVPTEWVKDDVYTCCAANEESAALMLTHYNDHDDTPEKTVKVELSGIHAPVKVSVYILDEEKDLELTKEEIFTSSAASVYLKMPIHTSALLKIEKTAL